MKSEPSEFSISDLERVQTEFWDGVRNYQVRNFIRSEMSIGDYALFYHSNTTEIGCAGVMKVTSEAKPDPTQFIKTHPHADPQSDPDNPRWYGVDVTFEEKFSRVVTLQELKSDAALVGMRLLAKGNRLSVTPITKQQFERICKRAAVY